jgi:hypothetical protein
LGFVCGRNLACAIITSYLKQIGKKKKVLKIEAMVRIYYDMQISHCRWMALVIDQTRYM